MSEPLIGINGWGVTHLVGALIASVAMVVGLILGYCAGYGQALINIGKKVTDVKKQL